MHDSVELRCVPYIRWDRVPGFQLDDVSRNDLGGGDHRVGTASNRRGGWGTQGTQGVHRLCRLHLLYEADNDIEHHDSNDDASLDPGTDAKGGGGGQE